MLPVTIMLRRLFIPRPTQDEVDFHWWFLESGVEIWSEMLQSHGFTPRRTRKVVTNQYRNSMKALETWEPYALATWKAARAVAALSRPTPTPEPAPPTEPTRFSLILRSRGIRA